MKLTESLGTVAPHGEGRMLVQIITPGVGSSGVYPEETLKAAAAERVFAKGTQMFADHPSVTEAQDRPERSIKDLAGVLTEDAYWDGTALVAEAKTFEPWRSVIAGMHDAIGVSIRAAGTVTEADEDGRPIITSLDEALSVDFVTKAGRGGKVRELYEAARTANEALPGGLTAGNLRARLEQALGEDKYLNDFTDEWVVYRDCKQSNNGLYRDTYTATDTTITLAGNPEAVHLRTTYDTPENNPSTRAGLNESKENQMELTESQYKALTEKASRVETLEAERDTAIERAETAEKALKDAFEAADMAAVDKTISEADAGFNRLETAGLKAAITRNDDGRVNLEAFKAAVEAAAADKRTTTGEGTPTGVGPTINESADLSDDELLAALNA